jgi:hypothetical protein
MPEHKIHYPPQEELQRAIMRARKVLARCTEVLQRSRPDTFLGRRREPISLSCRQDRGDESP